MVGLDDVRLANFQYAAPEQRVRGGRADERSDLYALGLILNEMFTGSVPHGTGYKAIGSVAPDCAYLDDLVEAMLRHDPAERPTSVDAIKQQLIARRNEFVERQRLSQLRQIVVPVSELDDPIARDPIRIVDFDWERNVLKLVLSQPVNPDWVQVIQFGPYGRSSRPAGRTAPDVESPWIHGMDRRIIQVEPNLLRIEQHLRIPGIEIGTDVAGPACIYAIVRVRRGSIAYLRGESRIRAPRRFALFLPPGAVVQAVLEGCDVTSLAVAFRPLGSDALPSTPVLLAQRVVTPPRSRADVLDRMLSSVNATNIARDERPSPLVAKAKATIDGEYGAPLQIARLAARLRTSPAVLSRAFRRAYGMPPVRYRHQVRVMDALMRFAEGAVPADVFQDVGFEDLSRFYKIFRTVACAPPGAYRPERSKIAKT